MSVNCFKFCLKKEENDYQRLAKYVIGADLKITGQFKGNNLAEELLGICRTWRAMFGSGVEILVH